MANSTENLKPISYDRLEDAFPNAELVLSEALIPLPFNVATVEELNSAEHDHRRAKPLYKTGDHARALFDQILDLRCTDLFRLKLLVTYERTYFRYYSTDSVTIEESLFLSHFDSRVRLEAAFSLPPDSRAFSPRVVEYARLRRDAYFLDQYNRAQAAMKEKTGSCELELERSDGKATGSTRERTQAWFRPIERTTPSEHGPDPLRPRSYNAPEIYALYFALSDFPSMVNLTCDPHCMSITHKRKSKSAPTVVWPNVLPEVLVSHMPADDRVAVLKEAASTLTSGHNEAILVLLVCACLIESSSDVVEFSTFQLLKWQGKTHLGRLEREDLFLRYRELLQQAARMSVHSRRIRRRPYKTLETVVSSGPLFTEESCDVNVISKASWKKKKKRYSRPDVVQAVPTSIKLRRSKLLRLFSEDRLRAYPVGDLTRAGEVPSGKVSNDWFNAIQVSLENLARIKLSTLNSPEFPIRRRTLFKTTPPIKSPEDILESANPKRAVGYFEATSKLVKNAGDFTIVEPLDSCAKVVKRDAKGKAVVHVQRGWKKKWLDEVLTVEIRSKALLRLHSSVKRSP